MKLRSIACVIDGDIIEAVQRGDRTGSDKRARYDISVVRSLRHLAGTVHLVAALESSTRTINELACLQPDVVFNLAFSAVPLEASFAGALEILGIPYTGSGPLGIALANDKIRSRQLLRAVGIGTPHFAEVMRDGESPKVNFDPPFLVKPVWGADSAGIRGDSVVNSLDQVLNRADRIWRRLQVTAICDEFIIGREFHAVMVEGRGGTFHTVAIVELRFPSAERGRGFKCEMVIKNGKRHRFYEMALRPALLSEQLREKVTTVAQRAANVLGVRGYTKVDMRIDDEDNITVLEVNPNPAIQSPSVFWPRRKFEQNLMQIINSAIRKARE